MESQQAKLEELEYLVSLETFWQSPIEEQTATLKTIDQIKKKLRGRERLLETEANVRAALELMEEEGETDDGLDDEIKQELLSYEAMLEEIELFYLMNGECDRNNAILCINSGAGGTESMDWADMLMRMFARWGNKNSYGVQSLEVQPGEEAGVKSASLKFSGEFAFGKLKREAGVHRLVRISPYDANKRRHTSFASVFVYPEIDDNVEIEINESDLRIDTYRASGAGGQHVNTTDSAVRITHLPTNTVVACQNERSQHQNKAGAMKILRAALYKLEIDRRQAETDEANKEKKKIEWGSQIRSYVLHPYQMVKDHRTEHETSNTEAVLDGDLNPFLQAALKKRV